jgi:hypothetical protein
VTEKVYKALNDNQKQKLKEKILVEFIGLPSIKKKISIMSGRNGITDQMFLDDVAQELFMMLWRKTPDEIINCYYYTANGEFNATGSFKRLTALSTTILGRAILSKNPSHPNKYNHSLLTRHKHYSTAVHIAPIPGVDNESSFDMAAEPEGDTLWDIIRGDLNIDELELLDIQINKISKGSKHNINEALKNKIENIVREKKLIMTKNNKKNTELYTSIKDTWDKYLNPIVVELELYNTVTVDVEAKQQIRSIYKQLNPQAKIDLYCGACVGHYLQVIKEWLQNNEPAEQPKPVQTKKRKK